MTKQDEFEEAVRKAMSKSLKEFMDLCFLAASDGLKAYREGKGKDENPVRGEGKDACTLRQIWNAGWEDGESEGRTNGDSTSTD